MSLHKLLEEKKCFKLVCAAGNEDAQEVEKLVAVYAKAGANFFDLCAKQEIVEAAKRALKTVIPESKLDNYHLCVSVGIKGDPHISKAKINPKKCTACELCASICLQSAIFKKNSYSVNKSKCIGCGKCSKECTQNAISLYCEDVSLDKILPPLVSLGISCIELHALGADEKEVDEKWKQINKCFDSLLSICLDRSKLGNEKLIQRVKRLIKNRKPYTTIVQADGIPMSGSEDDFKATLQTVAFAEILNNENLPVYILLSGGTNSKTAELCNLCEVTANCIAIGSYARKIVKKYIDRDDLLENKIVFNEAVQIAKDLVDKSLRLKK